MAKSTLRKSLGYALDYSRRMGRWFGVATNVRGASAGDTVRLLASGAASPVVSLRHLDRWQDPRLLFDTTLQVRGLGSFHVRANTDDLWHVLPGREAAIENVIESMLRPGDVFVDAGANIGTYTVAASRKVGGKGTVVAIEMMPETMGILRSHVTLNKLENVSLTHVALSDTVGDSITVDVPGGGKHGQASIVRSGPSGSSSAVTVSTSTLDAILAPHTSIRLIKMDLEGAEELALKGGQESLQRTQAIIFEDKGDDALIPAVEALGFVVRRLDGNNSIGER